MYMHTIKAQFMYFRKHAMLFWKHSRHSGKVLIISMIIKTNRREDLLTVVPQRATKLILLMVSIPAMWI